MDHRLVEESAYLQVIDEFPAGFFDYIIVDGLFRGEALVRSLPKLRPGGVLVFDNVNWFLPSDSRTPHSRTAADGPATEALAEGLEHRT